MPNSQQLANEFNEKNIYEIDYDYLRSRIERVMNRTARRDLDHEIKKTVSKLILEEAIDDESFRRQNLYSAVYPQCRAAVRADCNDASLQRAITAYLMAVEQDCNTVQTAIENKQNLIVEGCYIPFDWMNHFEKEYLDNIRYYCLIMSENYIKTHFDDIKKYENIN